MKTFTRLLATTLLALVVQLLSAQDILLTVSGEFHSESTSVDSILVENISNHTDIMFDSLPEDLPDYTINLTEQSFWGATGIRQTGLGEGFQPVVNFPGLIRFSNGGERTIPANITVYNLLGVKLYATHKMQLFPNGSVSLHLGISGIFLVRVTSPYSDQTFRAFGSDIAGKKDIWAEISGNNFTSPTLKNRKEMRNSGFSFSLGDSLRVTAYKAGCYTEFEEFKVEGSRSFHFFFREGLKPVADFTADKTSGRPPLTVTFTDLSYNDPTLWDWEFGNDQRSREQNPVFTYNDVGTYTVTLVVGNAFGLDTIIKENYITVEGCTSTIELPWVEVPGGSFQMGSNDGESWEKPVHTVTLDTFEITKYEITNAEYAQFLNAIGCRFDGHFTDPTYGDVRYIDMDNGQIAYSGSKFASKSGLDVYPVIEVSWYGANAFAQWVCGRLPTEAEWEFAARGGNLSRGTIYSGSNSADSVAWYEDNSDSEGNSNLFQGHGTMKVGLKKPNELGIYDMSGNVAEWCHDWYAADYYSHSPVENPQGPAGGTSRILRGGEWGGDSTACYVYDRGAIQPNYTRPEFGFRVAKSKR